MDLNTQRLISGAAGAGVEPGEYIDNLFHTSVWDGDGTGTTVYAGVDWFDAGKEALFIFPDRDGWNSGAFVYDTERGDRRGMYLSGLAAQTTNINSGSWDLYDINSSNATYKTGGGYNWYMNTGPWLSYNFRTEPGFFDIVQWSGNDANNRALAHNLQCKPGFIIVKCISSNGNWLVWHKSRPNDFARVNSSDAFGSSYSTYFGSNQPTKDHFYVHGSGNQVNESGRSYIAYLWADGDQSDGQIFGSTGTESLVKAGEFTQGAGTTAVTLGWEPQWIFWKHNNTSNNGEWYMADSTTGLSPYKFNYKVVSNNQGGQSDYSGQQVGEHSTIIPTADGFLSDLDHFGDQSSGSPVQYLAIRRPDEFVGYKGVSGNAYFNVVQGVNGANREQPGFEINFVDRVADFAIVKNHSGGGNWFTAARKYSPGYVYTNRNSDFSYDNEFSFDFDGRNEKDGVFDGGGWSNYFAYLWSAGSGFTSQMYYGTGSFQIIKHNLGMVPGMIWYKKISGGTGRDWVVWHMGLNNGNPEGRHIILNSQGTTQNDNAVFDGAAPNDESHRVKISNLVNESGARYMAFYFGDGTARGSGPGGTGGPAISKCGYYTGQVANQTITLGFNPTFWMCKRVNSGSGAVMHWQVTSKVVNNHYSWGNWGATLWLNDNGNQDQTGQIQTTTSTSITLYGDGKYNQNGGEYIYYAHA